MPYNLLKVTFVETALFTRIVHDYLTDDEYAELQSFLAAYPEAGDLIQASGGVRKLRWRMKNSGKRGGDLLPTHARGRDLAADAI